MENKDFKQLWQQQYVEQIEMENIIHQAKKFSKNKLLKIVLLNIGLLFTAAFISSIWIFFQPEFISTKIGIILVVLAIVFLMIFNSKLYTLVKDYKTYDSNISFLQQLKAVKQKQKYISTTVMNIYFSMLSLGLILYFYEYTSRMQLKWAIFSYAITALWILINWYYFKPKIIQKQNKQINNIINKVEKIQHQYQDDEV